MDHPFFAECDWAAVSNLEMVPPLMPKVGNGRCCSLHRVMPLYTTNGICRFTRRHVHIVHSELLCTPRETICRRVFYVFTCLCVHSFM